MIETLFVCATILIAQHAHQRHQLRIRTTSTRMDVLAGRLSKLEAARTTQFDQAAFDDLKTKVEGFRMAQGLKVSR